MQHCSAWEQRAVKRCYTICDVDEDLYDGVPVPDLPVIEFDVPDSTHLRRSLRYPNATDIDPSAAIEAALDPSGLIARDPKS